jgi:hypothetical protein
MNSLKMFRSAMAWLAGLLGLLSQPAGAAVVDEIAGDLANISGYVVAVEGGEVIIDLDAASGAAVGDIFTVIQPGKQLVHPVTRKVLGHLEEVTGILKLTRLQTGFSFTRPIGESDRIQRGDPIRRYEHLKTVFWDYAGDGQPLFRRLQSALPMLKWEPYAETQKVRPTEPRATGAAASGTLTFIYTGRKIEIRGPEFESLHVYPVNGSAALGAAPPGTAVAIRGGGDNATSSADAAPGIEDADGSTPAPFGIQPKFQEGLKTLANLPRSSLYADFIRLDQRLLLATTDGDRIGVLDATNGLEVLATAAPERPARILAVQWWQPPGGHRLFVAATAWNDETVNSLIFELRQNRLDPVADRIPRILGSFDVDGDGRPETLLGQEFEGEDFFGNGIRELKWTGVEIERTVVRWPLPRRFTVLGSCLADLTGDGRPEAAYIRSDILWIYAGGDRLYKSAKEIGGSLSFLTYDVDPTFQNPKTTTAAFEISPVASDLNGDGRPELLVPASDRNALGTVRIAPGIKKSWISVFKYENGRFVSGTLGDKLETPIQGLAVDGDRILLVATEAGDLARPAANSHLLAYALLE